MRQTFSYAAAYAKAMPYLQDCQQNGAATPDFPHRSAVILGYYNCVLRQSERLGANARTRVCPIAFIAATYFASEYIETVY